MIKVKTLIQFSGRMSKKDYWLFVLINAIFSIIALIIDNIFEMAFYDSIYGPAYCVYLCISFIPALSFLVRRLHDTGRSAWMMFIVLVPLVGSIWLLILMLLPGDKEPNKYGILAGHAGDIGMPKQNSPQFTIVPKADKCENTHSNYNQRDIIILSIIIWICAERFIWSLLYRVLDGFYYDATFSWFTIFSRMVWISLPIILAFTFQNKTKKIVGLLLGGLFFFAGLANVISLGTDSPIF